MKNIPNFEQFLNESNINESLDKHTKAVLKYIEGAVADAKRGNESSYQLGLIGAMNYHSRKIVKNLGVWKDIDKIAYGAPNLKAVEAILKKATMAANATGYVNEAMSKNQLDKEIQDIKKDLAPEGMGFDQKFDMADSILDDDDFAKAVKKHYNPGEPQEWLASRI